MRLVIVHHHLNRGGVTQVIQNHLRALAAGPAEQRPESVLILHDGQQEGWNPSSAEGLAVRMLIEPRLAYDRPDAKAEPELLAGVLLAHLEQEGLSPDETLVHVHNHSLGKSVSLPGALCRLSAAGWKLLLQVHDFAEDNRPANYAHLANGLSKEPKRLGELLYPQANHLHYATLTHHDAELLKVAGVDSHRVHPLPNPAAEFSGPPTAEEAQARVFPKLGMSQGQRLFAYPVRGIRRKNLGEMLLLAALASEREVFAVTLAPKNPSELKSFSRWEELADRLNLPCRFGTGGRYGLAFTDTLAASEALLTTSVAEGFGMVFLEAWLAGRPLVGRDLPWITDEFRESGMRLDTLWRSLPVPLELLDLPSTRDALAETHRGACRAYGVDPLSTAELLVEIDSLTSGGAIDFARLTPDQQAGLIERVATDSELKESLSESLGIDQLLGGSAEAGAIEANAEVVRRHYSPQAIGERLSETYQAVLQSSQGRAAPAEGGERLLRRCLSPERLHAVRLEP